MHEKGRGKRLKGQKRVHCAIGQEKMVKDFNYKKRWSDPNKIPSVAPNLHFKL